MQKAPVDEEELRALVAEGLTLREIAARIDRSVSATKGWLRRLGLQTDRAARRRRAGDDPGGRHVAGTCRIHGVTTLVRRGDGYLQCTACRVDSVARRRRTVKQILVDEAGGACVLCGYGRCIAALEFHHLDPATKRFGLSLNGSTRSLAASRAEAEKCVLLCSNCHAEVEAGVAELPAQRLRDPSAGAWRPDGR